MAFAVKKAFFVAETCHEFQYPCPSLSNRLFGKALKVL